MPAEDLENGGPQPPRGRRRLAVNTLVFSVATGLSRIAGLGREIVASSYFGTSGPFSAFTIAFQVPNLVRSLVADAALSAAFVPAFTELLEQGRRRDAFRLASTLFLLVLAVLGAITALCMLGASLLLPLLTGPGFDPALDDLTVGLARVLFPIVVLLGLNGLVVGVLNSYEHFAIPAIAPLVWNLVIVGALVGLHPLFDGPNQLYAYAIGVLVGTVVQFAMALPVLRRLDFHFEWSFDLRDPRVGKVLRLMLPVTIGLGLINFNLLINSTLGSLISDEAPRAIDAAFRIYMLPQGMFSVAVATVVFPSMARLAARGNRDGVRALSASGVRQIFLLLLPAAAATIALAEPITQLVYERGDFDADSTDQVAEALFWFSFSLPFAGANLMLTRTFFSLQKPRVPMLMAAMNLVLTAGIALALYGPMGIGGIVLATAVASAAMMAGQASALRRELGGLQGTESVVAIAKMTAAAVLFGVVAWGVWKGLDELVGRSLAGQLVSVGTALFAAAAVYAVAVLAARVGEAQQIRALLTQRVGRRGRRP